MKQAYSYKRSNDEGSLLLVSSDPKHAWSFPMKITVLAVALLMASMFGMAQQRIDSKTLELIKAKKIAFLTGQIDLTCKEAQKFWPVYNELEKARYQLMDKKRELESRCENPKPGMTEADYRKLALEMAAIHSKEGKLIEEYSLKMLDILPAEKVVKLYVAEGKFRATLLHEFRKSLQDKEDKKENPGK